VTIETTQHAFEDELFFSLRQQRNNWAKVAIGAVLVSALSVASLIIILPLNETKPFVVLVDKTTGEAEKIVQVRPASLEQLDAVLQAELVSYVSDRETYDKADSETRIPDVMTRSKDQAAQTLAQEWTSSSPEFPTTKSGIDSAQVRIVKKREQKNKVIAERSFVVTIGYDFKPNETASLQAVWKNPLGFTALTYRIDAETLQ
jgi:type IV secretion system protein VirB8